MIVKFSPIFPGPRKCGKWFLIMANPGNWRCRSLNLMLCKVHVLSVYYDYYYEYCAICSVSAKSVIEDIYYNFRCDVTGTGNRSLSQN